MTLRDLATWRAALHAGIDAVFTVLESAERARGRTIVRPAAQPDGPISELDTARAGRVMDRYGVPR